MNQFAVIGGTCLSKFKKPGVIFLARHGQKKLPPHLVDHQKNILTLKKKGVKEVIGICSVGSLKKEIKPGTIVLPDDFINFNPITLFSRQTIVGGIKFFHSQPQLDEELRNKISQIISKNFPALKFFKQGTYFQTKGPRFETKAEIKMIKNFADVVGMTMADEATVAREAGLKYACICSVDNYANGMDEKNTADEWQKNKALNEQKIIRVLGKIFA